MDKFNLREYLKHNPLLEKRKDYYFTTPRFIDPPGKMVSIQSVFDKIHFNLIKGDLSFLKNIKLYFLNLILGTTKVK